MKKFLFLLLFFPMQVLAADAMPMADVFRHPIVEGLLSAVILISLLAEIKTALKKEKEKDLFAKPVD